MENGVNACYSCTIKTPKKHGGKKHEQTNIIPCGGGVIAVVIILAIMVAFAMPFGDYIAGSGEKSISTFTNKSNESLSAASNKEYRFAAMRGLFQTLVWGATDQTGESLKYDTVETTDDSLRDGLVAFTSGEVDEINIKNASLFVVDVDGEFETATLNFDVSGLAREGERVAVYHYNETLGAWEYITTCDVGADRQITATFASLSPVALVNVTRDYAAEHNITGPVTILLPNVIRRYDGWLIMINKNALSSVYGDAIKEEYVFWYKVVGLKDSESGETDDIYLGSGYYYTEGGRLAEGNYYSVVIIPETEQYPNGAIGETDQIFAGNYVDTSTADQIELPSVGQTSDGDGNESNGTRVEINAAAVTEQYGSEVPAENVTWYKVVGQKDTESNKTNDILLGDGYSYQSDIPLIDGEYYAVICVPSSDEHPKGAYGVTDNCIVTSENDNNCVDVIDFDLIAKYDCRLIYFNLNQLRNAGVIGETTPVEWHKVIGEMDTVKEIYNNVGNDWVYGQNGYALARLTGDLNTPGTYYAVIRIDDPEMYPNGAIAISNTYTVDGDPVTEFITFNGQTIDDDAYYDCTFVNCTITCGKYDSCTFENCTINGGSFYWTNISDSYISDGYLIFGVLDDCILAGGSYNGSESNLWEISNCYIGGGTYAYCTKTNCTAIPTVVEVKAAGQYDNIVIMIDRNEFVSNYGDVLPAEGGENCVSCYKVVGSRDSLKNIILDTGDDVFLDNGTYYYTLPNAGNITDDVYFVIRIDAVDGYPNGILGISNVVAGYIPTP